MTSAPVPHGRSLGSRLRVGAMLAALHLAPLGVLVTGSRLVDWCVCGGLYLVTAFAVAAGLHRYFAHRSFRTSRVFQFLLGLLAATSFVDPIGFAGKHRLHHRHSDTGSDVHSPGQGLWFSWLGSLIDSGYSDAAIGRMARDLWRYPELVWLRRLRALPAAALAGAAYALGGYSMLAVGFCVSRLLVLHATSAVNYFGHGFGYRRFATRDQSTNSVVLGLLTFGEGWHNNHHARPRAARTGVVWWEVDLVFVALRALARLGLVWDLRR
jgi:stearoyl-CoA desaturase (delta-9 desaturase)